MSGKTIGYIRVSSVDQNIERQLKGIECHKMFTDKASGKDVNRPQLQLALEFLREGDTLVIQSMDRLARNVEDMRRLVRELTMRGITVRFLKENLTFSGAESPLNNLMLSMLGAFAEFERGLIRERQREGIAIAKAKGGVFKGRKRALNNAQVAAMMAEIAAGGVKTAVAKEYGISRQALYD